MAFKLAEGEHIVKSYDYATEKKLGIGDVKHSLILTDKRIVRYAEGKTYVSRSDVMLMALKSVNGSYKKNKSFWSKVKLVLGIPLCIVIIGIPIVRKALAELRACYLDLDFEFYPRAVGTETFGLYGGGAVESLEKRNPISAFFGRLFKVKKTKIYVDKNTAETILNEITALVMDLDGQKNAAVVGSVPVV